MCALASHWWHCVLCLLPFFPAEPSGLLLLVCKLVCVSLCTFEALSTTSWIVPLTFPSCDIERRSVSMATWLERPSSDSPFTATSWSLTCRRPSCKTRTHTSSSKTLCAFSVYWIADLCMLYTSMHKCLWLVVSLSNWYSSRMLIVVTEQIKV